MEISLNVSMKLCHATANSPNSSTRESSFEVVGTAGDGQEGLEKYKELYPNVDLVTMDITMPKLDGVSALEQIIEFDKDARVVMISALGKQDLVKKSLLLGAKNYIVKPLDRKKVLERVVSSLA